MPAMLTIVDLPCLPRWQPRPPLREPPPRGLTAPWIQLRQSLVLRVMTPFLDDGAIQVERKEPSNVNVSACLELQQADLGDVLCTPTSPAACRAASVVTLCSTESTTARTVAARQPCRECQRRKRHVASHQRRSASLRPSSQVTTARKPVAARPSRAHRGLLRDVTTVPWGSIFA